MKLGVVVINWNALADSERCIREVLEWRLPGEAEPPSVWLVDNASDEPGVAELAARAPAIRLVRSPINRGFGGANNLGISDALAARADAILLLNNDASLSGEALGRLVRTLRASPEIGVVGPSLWCGDRLLSVGGRDVISHELTHVVPDRLPTGPVDVGYVPGTVALIRREVFEAIGMLDPDFFFSGELADFCLRARQAGFRCVVDPRARASHDIPRSADLRDTLHSYYVMRNRFLFVHKYAGAGRIRMYCVWIVRGARAALGALARGRLARARALALGLLDGVRGRFGGQNARVLRDRS
jgi:hypothetical protein